MKQLLALLCLCLCLVCPVFAATFNWTNVANTTAYAAGDTVKLWGTFGTGWTVTNSGSAGNVIRFEFQPGAKMSAATWGAGGAAITASQKQYLIFDGGTIEATGNGSDLANADDCQGIFVSRCSDITIQNMAITNIFRRIANHADTTARGNCVWLSSCTNVWVNSNNLSWASSPLSMTYSAANGAANITFSSNVISHCNWGCGGGDVDNGAYANGFAFTNNWVENFDEWDSSTGNFHHNGIFLYGTQGSATVFTNVVICNNTFGPRVNHDTFGTAYVFFESYVYAPKVFNNLFLIDSLSTPPAQCYLFDKPQSGLTRVTKIWNNTFIGYSAQGTGIELRGGGADCRNNLFVNIGTPIYNAGDSLTGYTINYNVYNTFSGSGNFGDLGRAFGAWQALGMDANGSTNLVALDANYVPTSEDTVARDQGVVLAEVTDDHNGIGRDEDPDIGAFETQAGGSPPAGGATPYRVSGALLGSQ